MHKPLYPISQREAALVGSLGRACALVRRPLAAVGDSADADECVDEFRLAALFSWPRGQGLLFQNA